MRSPHPRKGIQLHQKVKPNFGQCFPLSETFVTAHTNVATMVQGLPAVPAIFTAIKRELGLVNLVWSSYPPQWRSLCALWLRVESALARTGHPDLSNDELMDLQVPADIQQWMIDKRRSDNTQNPSGDFRKIWTKLLRGVALCASKGKRSILNEMW